MTGSIFSSTAVSKMSPIFIVPAITPSVTRLQNVTPIHELFLLAEEKVGLRVNNPTGYQENHRTVQARMVVVPKRLHQRPGAADGVKTSQFLKHRHRAARDDVSEGFANTA